MVGSWSLQKQERELTCVSYASHVKDDTCTFIPVYGQLIQTISIIMTERQGDFSNHAISSVNAWSVLRTASDPFSLPFRHLVGIDGLLTDLELNLDQGQLHGSPQKRRKIREGISDVDICYVPRWLSTVSAIRRLEFTQSQTSVLPSCVWYSVLQFCNRRELSVCSRVNFEILILCTKIWASTPKQQVNYAKESRVYIRKRPVVEASCLQFREYARAQLDDSPPDRDTEIIVDLQELRLLNRVQIYWPVSGDIWYMGPHVLEVYTAQSLPFKLKSCPTATVFSTCLCTPVECLRVWATSLLYPASSCNSLAALSSSTSSLASSQSSTSSFVLAPSGFHSSTSMSTTEGGHSYTLSTSFGSPLLPSSFGFAGYTPASTLVSDSHPAPESSSQPVAFFPPTSTLAGGSGHVPFTSAQSSFFDHDLAGQLSDLFAGWTKHSQVDNRLPSQLRFQRMVLATAVS